MKHLLWISLTLSLFVNHTIADTPKNTFALEDVFSLEYASDVEISNDGKTVYFVRHFMDIQTDKQLSNIWSVDISSRELRPVTTGNQNDYAPTLAPNGDKLAYLSTQSGNPQIHLRWLKTGATAKLSNLSMSPSSLTWSPDGEFIAFKMFVKSKAKSPITLPGKPEDAKWAEPAIFIDDVYYRVDGEGFTKPGFIHIFVISADGGTPRQITSGDYNHNGGISWSRDSRELYFSANRNKDFDLNPIDSEIHKVNIANGKITTLTHRNGPDDTPKISPNGKLIAFTGFDDKLTNYENSVLYVMNIDGTNIKALTNNLDRNVNSITWGSNSKGLYFQFNDQGKTKVAYQTLSGKRTEITDTLGGKSIGRPYTGADFDVAKNGNIAFTYSDPIRPADVAVVGKNTKVNVLTQLNSDALEHKKLGRVEAIRYKSSADQRDISGWVVYPPGFDPQEKYPLILEIHGGPVAAYGPHFSAEVQLYAAAGFVVLFTNPRGSESYGKEFAQTIHHNYPGQDYDDLMSGVDTMIDKGFIDEKQLFVTGGSGGGVLTSWIVGHTDRFAAAVVAKPVINWYSFVLTADYYPFFYKYWFGKKPWEDATEYLRRSPISYVGNVTTPTMLLTGENDYRTPISESEQYYQALKLQSVEAALVRIPGASHGIYKRPSNLMSKVAHILWWFDKHRSKGKETDNTK